MEYTSTTDSKIDSCGTLGLNATGPAVVNSTVNYKGEVCSEVTLGSRSRAQTLGLYKKPDLLTVERYAERPFIFDNFTLSAAPYQVDVDFNDFTNLRTRLVGSVGFRCTLRFRVQIVGTPFVSGIYRLAWTPLNSRFRSDAWVNWLSKISQLPGVNINLHDSTEVQLVIPYNHIYDYLPTTSDDWPSGSIYGTVWLMPLIPVNVGNGGDGVKATIWLSFEDIEVEGATAGERTTSIVLQGPLSATGQEQSCVDQHSCIASGQPTLKTAIEAVSPQISAVAGLSAWAARKAAGFADTMGYAKANAFKTIKYVRASKWVTNNLDVDDTIPSLVSHAFNGVDTLVGTASDIDEMAIKNFVARPAVIAKFNLTTSDAPGYYKYLAVVSPYSCFYTTLNTTINNNQLAEAYPWASASDDIITSPLFYMANLFTMWRGSIVYRFDIGKTKFHAGRIRITYTPTGKNLPYAFASLPAGSAANDAPQYGKTVIWDLRESTYLEFVCPYEFRSYWTPYNQASATLTVSVIDPLICPSTVQSAVTVLVSASGGPDIEFANPVGPQFLPYATATNPALLLKDDEPVFTPADVFQSNDIVLQGPNLYDSIGVGTQDNQGTNRAIGESINSIKQLVSRPSYALIAAQVSTVPPNALALPTRANMDTTYYSWISYFNQVFAFVRGGHRSQVISNGLTTKISAIMDSRYASGTLGNGSSFMALWQGDYNNPLQFTIPHLSLTSIAQCGHHLLTNTTGYWGTSYVNKAVINPASGTATTGLGNRFVGSISATDDWQYFYQLPTPAMRGGGTTVATTASGNIGTAFVSAYQA